MQTMKSAGKLHQLIRGCTENNIDVVAVQEHRRQTTELVETHIETLNGSEWRFDYCSATQEGQGGVGLLMNSKFASSLTSTDRVSQRIMVANFAGNPSTTIMVAYASTGDKNKAKPKKVEDFFSDLFK